MSAHTLDRRPRSALIIPMAASVAAAVLASALVVTAVGGFGPSRDGNGNGGVVPPAKPSDDGSDAMPIKVALENVSGADVYVDIVDETGLLVRAESGKPAEGQSVGQYALEVENLDATTLRLKWVDYPIDNALSLYIFEHEGAIRVLLIQPEPTGPTDSVALDRELILSFSKPISADQIEAFLQEGLDTPG
jgi:hypothetical protein